MRKPFVTGSLPFLLLFCLAGRAVAQANGAEPDGTVLYGLKVAVDEVTVTFRATDPHGLQINDLKLNEVTLLDDGRPPRKVIAFQRLQDFPIRAGILMDMSQSMEETRPVDRGIAVQYAQRMLRQKGDLAFVVNFDAVSTVSQDWTSDAAALVAGIRNRRIVADRGSRLQGTAIFDAIYRACLNQFSHLDNLASGNVILLFSDGEDNASSVSLRHAIDMCQRSNTAIYAFQPKPKNNLSSGAEALAELASESGGSVFRDDDAAAGIDGDLRMIEAELRNRYRIIYKPQEMRRDGAFHRLEIRGSVRVAAMSSRSGYYAPLR